MYDPLSTSLEKCTARSFKVQKYLDLKLYILCLYAFIFINRLYGGASIYIEWSDINGRGYGGGEYAVYQSICLDEERTTELGSLCRVRVIYR